jgi:hypothetical protein
MAVIELHLAGVTGIKQPVRTKKWSLDSGSVGVIK